MPFPFSTASVPIASGQSLSPAFMVGVGDIVAITVPAAWTAADITFQASVDGVTFADVYDDSGTEIKVVTVAGKSCSVSGVSLPYVKLRSGTGAVPVAQAADRVLAVAIRRRLPQGV